MKVKNCSYNPTSSGYFDFADTRELATYMDRRFFSDLHALECSNEKEWPKHAQHQAKRLISMLPEAALHKTPSQRPAIAICDQSALFFYLHCDCGSAYTSMLAADDPFENYASSLTDLRHFNTEHPLYGGEPISVFTPNRNLRTFSKDIVTHLINPKLPDNSFIELRAGLYLSSPELVFARMANYVSEATLARIGMDLCARYYISPADGEILDRSSFLTSPSDLRKYLKAAPTLRGCAKALKALDWVRPNSGSPRESQAFLVLNMPFWAGGYALGLDLLNYDVINNKPAALGKQEGPIIDIVNTEHRVGIEYDGRDYHKDKAKDDRRRNIINSHGWTTFTLGKETLSSIAETEKFAHQVAKTLNKRIRKPKNWRNKHRELRNQLDLRGR